MKRIVIILLAVLLTGCYDIGVALGSGGRAPASGSITIPVNYHISGTASKVSVTYENAQGGTEQIASVSVPWDKTINVKYGSHVYVSAQNLGESGSVICQVRLDGKAWKDSASSGAYVIATCSGIVAAQ